jgi:phage replication O-like protein O
MSLFRAICDTCLSIDLTKNELKVFTALLCQTLGYGKSHDHLTDKRLADLTGIRIDRLHTAVGGVVDKGLFEVKASRYYQYRYQIAEKFLTKHPDFFTPHLPKNRADISLTETISETQTIPPNFGYKQNITFTSFNLTPLTQHHTPPPPMQKKSSGEHLPEQPAVFVEKEKDVVVIESKKNNIPLIVLPNIIEAKHHRACRNALSDLSFEKQQRVINTLKIKEKSEMIYNATGLLIALAKAERQGRLLLPIEKTTPPASTTSYHPSHCDFDSPDHPSNRQTDRLEDHIGTLNWLKTHAPSYDKSIPDFAQMMGMRDCLDDLTVVRRWLTSCAKQEQQSVDVLAYHLGLQWVIAKEG